MSFKSPFIKMIGLLFVLIIGVSHSFSADIASEKKEAYVQLINMYKALDFPMSREDIDPCQKKKSKGCLSVFNRVKNAKDVLFKDGRDAALTLTLETIKSGFLKKDWWEDAHSSGAVCALSLFDSEKEDERIFQFFKEQGTEFFKRLYHPYPVITIFASNRPDKNKWLDYIETLEGITSE